jgi:tRNA1(Val) A37 N6-methylase TrmN6
MYSQESDHFTKSISKDVKKQSGIYFTPKDVRDALFDRVNCDPKRILEPSCGTGEFIGDALQRYPMASITGVELNPELAESSRAKYKNAQIVHGDFLTFHDEQYDLIIGNPPYVACPRVYPQATHRQSNLYVEFLYKCLTEHLSPGGTLAFVIPGGIGNNVCYEPIRILLATLNIVHFEILDVHSFRDTNVRLCLLVVKNEPGTGKYVYKATGVYLTSNPPEKSITLGELPIVIKAGFTWSGKVRDYFSSAPQKIVFITCGNIKGGQVVLGPKTKYLTPCTYFFTGKTILIKSASGGKKGGHFDFDVCMYEDDVWSIENDVMSIQGPYDILSKVFESLKSERNREFMKNIVNNGHISSRLIRDTPFFE